MLPLSDGLRHATSAAEHAVIILAIFGKNVEDAFGPLLYLGFYFAGGFAAR